MNALARLARLAPLALGALALGGCAVLPFHHRSKPLPLAPPPAPVAAPVDTTARPAPADTLEETRPAPKRAGPAPARKPKSGSASTSADADSITSVPTPVTPVETMSPSERRSALARTAADTTVAGSAVRHCGGRALMPDQQATFDAVRSLLDQTRAALASGELWRAESLARKARQLASSLDCP